ncbi:MAG: DUF86 domain-containing protein [Actinomycetota bacterium]|nr:DUF86 domain-containing protein [Actinomycetota bacterium]
MSRPVEELLSEALLHFEAATVYAKLTDEDPQMIVDAMSMRLFAGLDALTRLPDGVADRLFGGDWPDMRGLRHRIAHGYAALSLTRVRETVTTDLQGAIKAIRREFADSGHSPQEIEEQEN